MITLGLGIGLNAAVFSAVYGIVLRPLLVNGLPRTVVGILPRDFRSPVRPGPAAGCSCKPRSQI
jgi:hypothetical protein